MSVSDRELEEAGRKLRDPPSSVHEILSLLDVSSYSPFSSFFPFPFCFHLRGI